MINREIPFRPKLEGDFRIRFYNAVSAINENTPSVQIEEIVIKEIDWVENKCAFNLKQRKKYRAVWLLFRDLIRASWKAYYREGVLLMQLPSLNKVDSNDISSPEIKARLRSWMEESRHERIVTYSDFINRMENPGGDKKSIKTLIADGDELEQRLRHAEKGEIAIKDVIKPYLQLVNDEKDKNNTRDPITGLKYSEIWRYFRLTWSTPSETTPGRTMLYLIRDAAHPNHPVMGIASLENSAVQITCRDDYIGWNQKGYIEKIITKSSDEAYKEFEMLLSYLDDGIAGIDYKDICDENVIQYPSLEDIQMLLDKAANAEQHRQNLLKKSNNKFEEKEKSKLGHISKEVEDALYRRKRAEQLARLLNAKKAIVDIYNSKYFNSIWIEFCKSEFGESAIRTALVAQKTKHIGSSIMELNVCGAIPPYNEVLGGKLVALLAISPQVIHDYKERYANKCSEIASRLKREPVYRPADLVYIGTTSLYYVGSSQYNRLKIPKNIFNCDFDVIWKKIGMTMGFGTLHISKETTLSLMEATNDGYKINHVFGEGSSPKMRLLTMAIRELLESTNEDSKEFSKHAMPRIVYGANLASNTFDYLLGKDASPEYYTSMDNYMEETQKIIDYWSERWLASRLNYSPIYDKIKNFNKEKFLLSNEINKHEEWSFSKLKEVSYMPTSKEEKDRLQFIQNFYRGSSAYADYMDKNDLYSIHLETKLDKAILESVVSGKDVVLTGNPGDGKTHIIRILKDNLQNIGKMVTIELDASTLTYEEIYNRWKKSREEKKPFIIAINAAILYSLYKSYPNFEPVKNAYYSMSNSVVFHNENIEYDDLIVFDLSKREVLTKDIIKQAILKLTDEKHYTICKNCPILETCEVQKNRRLLNNELFQERLFIVLKRVVLQGYHATLRELQSFISYLIFGNKSCKQISKLNGNSELDIVNLIYSGKGKLFNIIRESIDPNRISHPIWDELILSNNISSDSWIKEYIVPKEAIAYDNNELFQLRKRQFYFFNKNGDKLLEIMDDDVSRFEKFLEQEDKKIIKEIIKKLNTFFGVIKTSSDLEIWSGHRYNNDPRKILISMGSLKASAFKIGKPVLQKSMKIGIEMYPNYIRFERKNSSNIFLKIDFDMYNLLTAAERGVPVLFMESDIVKKVWRFIEQLQSVEDIDEEEVVITLLDVENKQKIRVSIDREEDKYESIEIIKN